MNNCLVRPYAAPDLAGLAPLLKGQQFLATQAGEFPLENDPVCRHLREVHGDDGGAWVVVQQGKLRAFGCFRKLIWDSQQLRMSAARIDYLIASGSYSEKRSAKEMLLEELLVEAQHLGVWHLSARVDAADLSSLHVLEEAGFITVDSILSFAVNLKEHPVVAAPRAFQIRLATADDAPQAAALARTAYIYDRFHADPFIVRDLADELHAEWVSNSCSGKAADAVLIAKDESGLLGFITCKLSSDDSCGSQAAPIGTIVLIAAATRARGRRVGYNLTMAALEWFRSNGCESVEVSTQLSNIPASRLYQTCGFRLRETFVSLRRLL